MDAHPPFTSKRHRPESQTSLPQTLKLAHIPQLETQIRRIHAIFSRCPLFPFLRRRFLHHRSFRFPTASVHYPPQPLPTLPRRTQAFPPPSKLSLPLTFHTLPKTTPESTQFTCDNDMAIIPFGKWQRYVFKCTVICVGNLDLRSGRRQIAVRVLWTWEARNSKRDFELMSLDSLFLDAQAILLDEDIEENEEFSGTIMTVLEKEIKKENTSSDKKIC